MQHKQYQKSLLVYRGRKKNNNNSSRYQPNIDNKTQNLKSIHRTLVQKSKNQPLHTKPQPTSIQKPQLQRSSIISTHDIKQKQKSTLIKKVTTYGSMHQLNPYLNKSDSKQQSSIYRSGKSQSQQRKLKNQRQSRSRHNLSVQALIENERIKRANEQQRQIITRQKSTLQPHRSPQPPQSAQKSVNFYINIEKLRHLKISSRQKIHDVSVDQSQSNIMRQSNPYLTKKINNNNHNVSLNSNNGKQLSADKRSLVMKTNKNNRSVNGIGFERMDNPFKFLTNKKHPNPIKPRLRYKTHHNDDDDQDSFLIVDKSLNHKPKSHASQNMLINNNNKSHHSNMKSSFRKDQLKDKSFIDGYLKGKQLGRGGFSKVWEGFHFLTKQFFAIKEIDTTNKYQTHLTEIWFGNHFFDNGKIKPTFQTHAGSQKLLKMFQYSIIDPRAFIVYQSCDGSLGNMLYDIYEQQTVGENDTEGNQDEDKLYMIKYKHLYGQLRKNSNFIKHFIKSIAQALDLLAINKIVHSDIKTENILLKKSQYEKKYQFKLIDYGSSFVFESLKQYKLATPQYMCPQLLNYILFENKKPCYEWMLEYVKTYQNISAIDTWGLGCIVIQLIHGLPLWLNNPTRILIKGRYQTKKGLFAVNDRSFSKILQKQLSIVNNFDDFITNENNSDIFIDQQVKDVLKAMLNPNPKHRIRPHDIVSRLST